MDYLTIPKPFPLEAGGELEAITIAYTTQGRMSADRDNVVWVFHALTANAAPEEWWPGLVGEGKLLDPNLYYIVCANMLGSCYGSTGASNVRPSSGQPYGRDFPLISIRDMVQAHDLLREHLGIETIRLGIGGSMGGQQLLEWAVQAPKRFDNICVLATNAQHSPWGIAFNEAQRMALLADPTLYEDSPTAGHHGLAAARAVAMLSYRNYRTYDLTQREQEGVEKIDDFRASSYQRYQGHKLVKRFKPVEYLTLSWAMDSHNLGRGRGGCERALARITANALVIGIQSDVLFPVEEQAFLARYIPKASLEIIDSTYGHDGFLIEFERIAHLLRPFVERTIVLSEHNGYPKLQQPDSFGQLQRQALPGSEPF